MKRKNLLFLLLLTLGLPWAADAQTVTIGTGTSTQNMSPVANFYNYSLTEMIYTADEIAAGNPTENYILNLGFQLASNGLNNKTYSISVYMKNVEADQFETAAFTAVSGNDLVYEGTMSATASGWVTIELSIPFFYDNTKNLLIAINKTGGGYAGNSYNWNYTSTSGAQLYQHLYKQQDTPSAFDINNPPTSPTRNYNRPNVQLTFGAPPTCINPTMISVDPELIEENQASVEWTENGSATDWVLQYSTNADFTNPTEINRHGIPSIVISGLAGATDYYVRVKADCGNGDQSGWSNVVSFTTLCDTYDIPYTYDFEEASPFNCWTAISGTVTVRNSTSNSHNSSYYLDFRGTTSNMIALPQFNPATNTLRVEFWTRPESTGGNSGKFAVGYMTDITDASTFVAVETYNSTEMTTSYVKKTVDLVNVPANANIAMRQFDCSTNYYWYVDDVTVKEIPSCVAPTALAANASTISAELSWTANSGETAWTLYYKKTTDENYTEVPNVDENPYTLEGLTASTNYQYYVVANCSADDASEPSEVFTFATECEAISTYPWTENFDSYTGVTSGSTNNLPLCWNHINTTSNNTYKGYPVIYNASGYSHSGNNHLRFYSYAYYYNGTTTSDPQDQYAILPEMENLNGKQLSLYARGANTNSFFKVGLMTDPTDVSTFVEIATTIPTTSYEEYIYDLTGTGSYIAIMIEAVNSSATSRTVYIDDITIDFPPACPKPTDLIVVENSVTAHTAQLGWTSEATAWIVAYKTAADADFTEVNANENPFTLTGLAETTTYTAKVRAVCDGTPGEWSTSTVSFTTPIACPAPTGLAVSGITGYQTTLNWTGTSDSYDVLYRTAAYTEGVYEEFGTSIPSGWEMYTGLLNNGTATMTPTTSTCWVFGNSNGVFDNHARVNIYGNYQRWLVTKTFTVLQDASTLSFDLALTAFNGTVGAPATTGTDDKFIVLISTDNMATWITLREWNNAGSEYVYNNIANTATGEPVSIDLSAYIGQSVRIAFYGESTESNADNNLHIDNVYCGIPYEAGEWQTAAVGVSETTYTLTGLSPETDYEVKVLSNCDGETGHETNIVSFTTEAACMVPTELDVVSITTTTAVVRWTTSSSAWQIKVNDEDPIDVTENPYTLEGLNPATTYTFMVRANCDGTYTEWSEPISFTTECEVFNEYPYTENFDSYTAATGFLPVCWNRINTGTSYNTNPYIISSNAHSTSNCLYLYTYGSSSSTNISEQYAILPEMENLAGKQITLFAKGNNNQCTFKIGTMTDPTDATTFTAIATQELTTTYQEFIYDVPATATDSYIAIMMERPNASGSVTRSVNIDDIVIDFPPTCPKPTDLAAVTTTNSATLTWTANGEETEWTIYYREVTDELGEYIAVSGVTDNPYLLDDVLEAATQYEFYVVANCSADDASEPSEVMSFNTKCDPITDFPWSEDFESYDASASGVTLSDPCWENIHLAGDGAYFFEVYSGTNGTNSTKQLRLHDMTAGTMTKLMLPGMTLPDDNYEFVIDVYRSNSTFNTNNIYEGIRVFVSTDGEIEDATELAFIPRQYNTGNDVIPEEEAIGWYTYHLPIGVSGTCYIVLRGESQYCTATYMDNFEVKEMPFQIFTKEIIGYNEEGGGWYLISSPMGEVPVADVNNMTINDFDLYYFDQQGDEDGNEWMNYELNDEEVGFTALEAGKGYLYANIATVTLEFPGTAYTGEGTFTLEYSDQNEDETMHGWNLMGNPYNAVATLDRPFYRMESDAFAAYDGGMEIEPMEGVLVFAEGAGETVTFTPAGDKVKPVLALNLSSNSKVLDRAVIGFGQGQRLPKLQFNRNSSKVYFIIDNKDYAIVRSEGMGEMPVSFKAEKNGSYTLSFNAEEVTFNYLHLIDNMTGIETDLLNTPSYTFEAKTTDYASRFKLVFVCGDANDDNAFAFYSNGSFVINNEGNATLQVVDVNGRILKSESINGCANLNFNAAPGIYMLRLVNGENVKVQKVVVK